jgi:ketosteroid isomerase-like protein
MNPILPVLLAAVVMHPAGNAQQLDPTAELRALVGVEHAFAKAVAAQGIQGGFLAYLGDDAVLFHPGPVDGRQWTTDHPGSKAALGWEPIFADVSRSGDLGYTTGPWEMRERGAKGRATAWGNYVTLWRKQTDGTWKVALDVGTSNPRPAGAPRPFRPSAASASRGATVLRPAADPDSERAVVLAVEREFSAASSAKGTPAAYEIYAARELRLFRPGRTPAVGALAARAFLQSRSGVLTWEPERVEVTRASDLAYSYGSYRYGAAAPAAGAPAESGYFVHIWKRQTTGAWRLVLDLTNPAPQQARQ